MNYYNEIDKFCAQWLRNLVDAAFIPDGDVDERSIVDVSAAEVRGYTQCHFFAGIGGWSYALRLAGWGEDRRVWTGSCPCQPFSVAGQRKGKEDARHLWPDFHRLIGAVRPDVVMGEQVGGAAGYAWLDGVCDDLAEEGYRCDAIDIPACSVGAPHIRQRLYWVAHPGREHDERRGEHRVMAGAGKQFEGQDVGEAGWDHEVRQRQRRGDADSYSGTVSGLAHPGHARMRRTAGAGEEASGRAFGEIAGCGDGSAADGLGHPNGSRSQGRGQHSGEHADQWVAGQTGQLSRVGNSNGERCRGQHALLRPEETGWQRQSTIHEASGTCADGFWSDYAIVHCTDGKARRTKPGLFPLAHGISGRVDKLRAIGNAIVPELAAEVIRAWMETMPR